MNYIGIEIFVNGFPSCTSVKLEFPHPGFRSWSPLLLFFGTLGFTAPFVLTPMKSPLPYMATPSKKLRRALKHIQQKSQEDKQGKKALTFVDLGSGDGSSIYLTMRQFLNRHQLIYHGI